MAAFGCNFEGEIPHARVLDLMQQLLDIAAEHGVKPRVFSLADTMAWATPKSIRALVGKVRDRFPDLTLSLHLHDTRGMGIANAYAGLEMGVAIYNSAVAGLGGCPFAAHKGAAGNVCTEDLVFMLHEMGIETGIDLEQADRGGAPGRRHRRSPVARFGEDGRQPEGLSGTTLTEETNGAYRSDRHIHRRPLPQSHSPAGAGDGAPRLHRLHRHDDCRPQRRRGSRSYFRACPRRRTVQHHLHAPPRPGARGGLDQWHCGPRTRL